MFRKLGLILGVAIAISAAALIPTAASGQVWQRSLARRSHLQSNLRRLFRLLHCQTRNRYALRASRAAHQGLRLVHGHCQLWLCQGEVGA